MLTVPPWFRRYCHFYVLIGSSTHTPSHGPSASCGPCTIPVSQCTFVAPQRSCMWIHAFIERFIARSTATYVFLSIDLRAGGALLQLVHALLQPGDEPK